MNPMPLGEMPCDQFLAEYWQKKPLLIRNALPNVSSPVSAEVLAGLACEEEIESRIVIQHQSEKDWELKHGPFKESDFSTLPDSNWTLLVQAVDHWNPEAAKFLEQFTFIPRWRIDDLMISYACDGGGVGPHYDNYDVFLVQTSGKRKWEIGGIYNEDAPLLENLPVSILSDFSATESWVLEPGDILYVPAGFAHNGIAEGNGCITCSVGFRAPSHSEILREYTDFIGENLSEAMRYEDPDLLAQKNTGEISSQTIEKIQRILQKYTEDKESISNWFGRYITSPKYSQESDAFTQESEKTCTLDDLKMHLDSGKYIFRNESSRFAFKANDNNFILFVDGENFDKASNLNPLIETLCANIKFSKQDITQTDKNLTLLLKLLQRGSLYLAEI
jgi:50S ribosomal protein L16 3-hydroxylase